MPNIITKGMLKIREIWRSKQSRKQWWQLLEPFFVIIALVTALVACASLTAWSFISFSLSPSLYSIKTEPLDLKNGQKLQVEYPNVVQVGDDPSYIKFTVSDSANVKGEIKFEVTLPPGLTLIEPTDQAEKQIATIIIEKPEDITTSKEYTLGVINSQSVWEYHHIQWQSVSVRSTSLDAQVDFSIGIETIPWISASRIVNSTFNEKSPLILLVTGLLSGAGTLVFQFAKSRRDTSLDEQQKIEKEYNNRLKDDMVGAIKFFVSLNHSPQYDTYQRLVEQSGWEDKLPALVLEKLNERKKYEAKQIAKTLSDLCSKFTSPSDGPDLYIHLKALDVLCKLTLIEDPRNYYLTMEDASSMLIGYKRWPVLKPFITRLIHEFAHCLGGLNSLSEKLTVDNDGMRLLVDANIQKLIDNYVVKTLDRTPENEAAKNINRYLALEINWRPLWSIKGRRQSDKVRRWLAARGIEVVDENFTLGSEYAELDGKLSDYAIEHPGISQIDGPSPVIVFGDEGMGKTAFALRLVNNYQKLAKSDSKEPKILPVYAPFETGVDLKEWLVEKISRALIDFVADNPRHFLSALESRKTAMSRLIQWHIQNTEALRFQLYSSPFISPDSDSEQVIEYITGKKYKRSKSKLGREEMLNMLFMAKPDLFDQICFLWDIPSSSPQDEVAIKLKEMHGLALDLAKQNVFIKVFAPQTAKQPLPNSTVFRSTNNSLIWEEAHLRTLIENRIDKFNLLWEKSKVNPIQLVVNTSGGSPRRLIKILIRLMDYVDDNLNEDEKLNTSMFEQVRLSLEGKK